MLLELEQADHSKYCQPVKIEKDQIWSTVYIKWATLLRLERNLEFQYHFAPSEPIDEQDDNVEAWNAEFSENEKADAMREYTVYLIVRIPGKGCNIMYVVRWYSHAAVDGTVKTPQRIP